MTNKRDILQDLFKQIPQERHSDSLRSNTMYQIMIEAERMRKRNEHLNMSAFIAALFLMAGTTIGIFFYLKGTYSLTLPEITIPDRSLFPFYFYIGFLALILLGIDHKFKEIYKKKYKKERSI